MKIESSILDLCIQFVCIMFLNPHLQKKSVRSSSSPPNSKTSFHFRTFLLPPFKQLAKGDLV